MINQKHWLPVKTKNMSYTLHSTCLLKKIFNCLCLLLAYSSMVAAGSNSSTSALPRASVPELKHITVNTAARLKHEVTNANKYGGYVSLYLEDGLYQIDNTLAIKADYISILSKSGSPENVIIQGSETKSAGTPVLIKVYADHFSIDGITLRNAKFHLIQIAGEHSADYSMIRNCIFQDSYQQLVKITYGRKNPETSSDFGIIENSTFRYTAGIGPNYYIGGIDAHGINNWIIRKNRFKDIASPGDRIAEHAIHIWNGASNNLVENNYIEDCDRAIGFGMGKSAANTKSLRSNRGGVIRNNTIIHSNNLDPFADAGITLEDSPDTLIENNKIWLGHNYPNAIEYRYPTTQNVIIRNNISNKGIVSRNGGKATLLNNRTNASLKEILR